MVGNLDHNVGRLLGELRKRGLDKNTLVIFTSDNGGFFDSSCLPLRGRKGAVHEGGIRVPMIVRWPGKTRAGSTSNEQVISMDIFPTVLAAAGLPLQPGQHSDGLNLTPVLTGKGKLPERTLFWHFPFRHRRGADGSNAGAIRQGDWKLIRYYTDGREELYDLSSDMLEKTDQSSSQTERHKAMSKKLDAFLSSVSKGSERSGKNSRTKNRKNKMH